MAGRRLSGPEVRDCIRAVVADYEERRETLRGDTDDAEALHGYRKAARRVMAAVCLAEPYLTPVRFVQATTLAAPLARGLGKCRDSDVLAKRLGAIAKRAPKAIREDLRTFNEEPSSKERSKRVKAAIRNGKPRHLRRPLEGVLADASRSLQDPLHIGLARLRFRCARVTSRAPLGPLHAFRLELKSYRYGLEALKPAKRSVDARLAAECHEATEVLGRIVDAHVLADLAAAANGKAAEYLRAVAVRDDEAARRDFHAAWTGDKWPTLQAELRGAPR